ncbi:MAG TPA: hypothetical protein VK533_16125 [Sphingomonas sp.]|uniref:hypothetical protein n=1 Tax=Sphingomonas sp. TaxID=28214 RepID=UPI002CCF1266|nr:hypothetical protein [Sphingomonas sp.]HMI21060.1 hypothetical protein [Sphingomonas sp.]
MRPLPMTIALLLTAGAGRAAATPSGPIMPAASRTTPAQQMIALYRDEYRHGFHPCALPSHANEVVVCGNGRGGSAERLPLPDERGPPDGPRAAIGEPVSGKQALIDAAQPCRAANCPAHGAVDLVAAGTGLAQVVRAIVDPEGASDYADRHPWKPQQ